MGYKKVKVKFETLNAEGKVIGTETRDYLQFRRFVGDTQRQVVYRAPDTDAGRDSLDRRRKA